MEKLFSLHDAYISQVPMEYTRGLMEDIDWNSRLIGIKGPKGVGKSTPGHKVEYGGLKTGDFGIDGNQVIEVGGPDKGFSQVKAENEGYVAADGIESAVFRKVPLWAFGFLY